MDYQMTESEMFLPMLLTARLQLYNVFCGSVKSEKNNPDDVTVTSLWLS